MDWVGSAACSRPRSWRANTLPPQSHSVGVLCHQSLVEPASNLQPLRALSIREGKISGLGGIHFCGPFDRMPPLPIRNSGVGRTTIA